MDLRVPSVFVCAVQHLNLSLCVYVKNAAVFRAVHALASSSSAAFIVAGDLRLVVDMSVLQLS